MTFFINLWKKSLEIYAVPFYNILIIKLSRKSIFIMQVAHHSPLLLVAFDEQCL